MISPIERSGSSVIKGMQSELVHREQIDSIFRQLRLSIGVDAVAGGMLAVFTLIFAEKIYPGTYLWIAVLFGNCGFFYWLGNSQIGIKSNSENIQYRERILLAMVVLSGCIWGCTWLLAPLSAEQLVVAPKGATIIWFCVMLANATIVLSVNSRLFLSFAVPAIALQVAFAFYMGARQDFQIAGALLVILGFSTFMATRIGRDLNRTILLQLRNRELNEKLSQDEEILEQREAELTVRIQREEALLLEKQNTDNKLVMAANEKLLLLDAVGEGIFGINNLGNITFVNAMALQSLKLREADVIGEDALEILCRGNTESGKEAITRKSLNLCLFSSKSVQSVDGIFCGKDNMLLPVRFSCRPITEKGNLIGAVVSFVDMTTQLEMESKLLQAEKMEAIGRITGGVAHDFNNLLTVIVGNLQFLRRRLANENRESETAIIDKLMKAAKNGAELNKRLLSFSREQALQSKAEDINSILLDMESFIRGAIGEDIELHLSLNNDDNTVKIDRTQFENVIVNLCVNAKDAMPDGGTLEIATRLVKLATPTGGVIPSTEELDFVEITLTDSGLGIPLEIQAKVFDPFFTTKKLGEGSGFGLSTAFGFMQQSGGNISMKSSKGKGTTFTLHLPLADEKPTAQSLEAIAEHNAEQFSGTILLVEDDSEVRDVATQMLLEAGYTVIAANDGNAGLERFSNNPNIDLVFSDIMMPGGMNGIDMAKRILQLKPAIPILLATGYATQILKEKIDESTKVICISKPYDTDRLPELINSMLVNG